MSRRLLPGRSGPARVVGLLIAIADVIRVMARDVLGELDQGLIEDMASSSDAASSISRAIFIAMPP